jgi:hypothetical protein
LHGVALDFVEFEGRHTGVQIASQVNSVIDAFGLKKKVIGIVVDNATANDVAMKSIAETVLQEDGANFPTAKEFHFRCFGHILNLGCKGMFK